MPDIKSLRFVTFCPEEPIDTVIRLTNSGTVPRTGTLRLVNGLVFSIPATVNVAPGDTEAIAVRFLAGTSGTYSDTLIIESEPCSEVDTVVLTGEVEAATYSISPFNFGAVPVGSTRQGVIVVDNPTGSALHIVGARVIPSGNGVTIPASQGFPVTIPPNSDSVGVRVSYRPDDLTPIPPGTRIELIIDQPCRDTITAEIRGFGSDIGLTWAPQPVDMGGLLRCNSNTDTIWVYNNGTSTVQLSTISFDPANIGFSAQYADPANATPSLQPGDSTAIELTFAPVSDPAGQVTGTMRVTTSDPGFGDLEIPVRGVKLQEDVTINAPTFPQTFPGGSSTQQFTIENTGTATVTIRALDVSPPFRVVSTSPSLPRTVSPTQSLDVVVEFAPLVDGTFKENIGLETVGGCDTIAVPISAISAPALNVQARWGDTEGEPGDIVRIPLELPVDLSGAGVRDAVIDLHFNPSMLLPHGVDLTGTIAEDWNVTSTLADTGAYLIDMSGSDELTGAGVVAYVEATVLLGNDTATPLWSTNQTRFSTGGARLSVDSGSFQLKGFCRVETNRLVTVDGAFGLKSVTPNPAQDNFTVTLETVEDGETALSLYALDGSPVRHLFHRRMKKGVYAITTGDRLPSGSFVLVLSTPTQRDWEMVVIQR
jgi:hypothetical protein